MLMVSYKYEPSFPSIPTTFLSLNISIMQFTTTYMLLFALFSTIAMALPLVLLETRDVYAPPVLYPGANTIWKVGSKHNVTW